MINDKRLKYRVSIVRQITISIEKGKNKKRKRKKSGKHTIRNKRINKWDNNCRESLKRYSYRAIPALLSIGRQK